MLLPKKQAKALWTRHFSQSNLLWNENTRSCSLFRQAGVLLHEERAPNGLYSQASQLWKGEKIWQ